MQYVAKVLGFNKESMVGHGNFSDVYDTGRGTVLKLTVDEMYMEYVAISEKNQHNSLFPRIVNNFGIVGYVSEGCPIFAVELPKLKSFHDMGINNFTKAVSKNLWGIDDGFEFGFELDRYGSSCDSFEELVAGLDDVVRGFNSSAIDFMEVLEFVNKVKPLLKHNCFSDFSLGNVMFDGLTLVITDPIASIDSCSTLGNSDRFTDVKSCCNMIDVDVVEKVARAIGKYNFDVKFLDFMQKVSTEKKENDFSIVVKKSDNFGVVRSNYRKGLFNDPNISRNFSDELRLLSGEALWHNDPQLELAKLKKRFGG